MCMFLNPIEIILSIDSCRVGWALECVNHSSSPLTRGWEEQKLIGKGFVVLLRSSSLAWRHFLLSGFPAVQFNSKHQTLINSRGLIQQKLQDSAESTETTEMARISWNIRSFGIFSPMKWRPSKTSEEARPAKHCASKVLYSSEVLHGQWRSVKIREVLHGITMQKWLLIVYRVPFILFSNVTYSLKHLLQQNIKCVLSCLLQ